MCEMTHISQAVGGFIRGGNAGPRGSCRHGHRRNCLPVWPSSGLRRTQKGTRAPGRDGGDTWELSCASADSSRLLHPEGKRGAEEEEGTRR